MREKIKYFIVFLSLTVALSGMFSCGGESAPPPDDGSDDVADDTIDDSLTIDEAAQSLSSAAVHVTTKAIFEMLGVKVQDVNASISKAESLPTPLLAFCPGDASLSEGSITGSALCKTYEVYDSVLTYGASLCYENHVYENLEFNGCIQATLAVYFDLSGTTTDLYIASDSGLMIKSVPASSSLSKADTFDEGDTMAFLETGSSINFSVLSADTLQLGDANVAYAHVKFDGDDLMCDLLGCSPYEPSVPTCESGWSLDDALQLMYEYLIEDQGVCTDAESCEEYCQTTEGTSCCGMSGAGIYEEDCCWLIGSGDFTEESGVWYPSGDCCKYVRGSGCTHISCDEAENDYGSCEGAAKYFVSIEGNEQHLTCNDYTECCDKDLDACEVISCEAVNYDCEGYADENLPGTMLTCTGMCCEVIGYECVFEPGVSCADAPGGDCSKLAPWFYCDEQTDCCLHYCKDTDTAVSCVEAGGDCGSYIENTVCEGDPTDPQNCCVY